MPIIRRTQLSASLGDYELDFAIEGHLVPWSPESGGLAPFVDTSKPEDEVSLVPISVETSVTELENGDIEILRTFQLERAGEKSRMTRRTRPLRKGADLIISTDFWLSEAGNIEFIGEIPGVLLEWGLGTPFSFGEKSITPNNVSYEINPTFEMFVEHLYEI